LHLGGHPPCQNQPSPSSTIKGNRAAGANLSETKKSDLKKLNLEISTLENDFKNKLLAATQAAAYTTTDKSKLDGLSAAQLGAAAQTAKTRKQEGWVLALQNTTQQTLPRRPQ
jgi:peptidyl-dipeptidase Dcp